MKETIISKETTLEGNISSKEDFIISGDINGIIEGGETISLESDCHVTGKIFAKTLIVKGIFTGDADCTTVHVCNGGKFIGNIKSKILMIDSKGIFEGKSEMKKAPLKKQIIHKELDTENILL